MYRLMAFISFFVRCFLLSNPFEMLEKKFVIFGIVFTPAILNIIAEPVLTTLTFYEVSLFYNSGEFPSFGSFMFLVIYCVNSSILFVMCWLGFHWYTNILVFFLIGTIVYFLGAKKYE